MLFFLHHCELPSLDNIHFLNPAPVNIHLNLQLDMHRDAHHVPEAEDGAEEGEEDLGSVQDGSEHLEESNSGSVSPATEQEGSGYAPPAAEHDLMRPQLHRTESGGVGTGASLVSSQANSHQPQLQQLSEEELRQARLQHFEKKIE